MKLIARLVPGTAIVLTATAFLGADINAARIDGGTITAVLAWGLGMLWIARVLQVAENTGELT